MWGVRGDPFCNKRGQTSSAVIGTEIQASCNIKPSLCDHYYLLACGHCFFIKAALDTPNSLLVCHRRYFNESYNLDFLLHEDIPQPPSSSKSSTGLFSTTEPNKSTEHSAIQKGSVHCNMATTDAGRLLSTLWRSIVFDC